MGGTWISGTDLREGIVATRRDTERVMWRDGGACGVWIGFQTIRARVIDEWSCVSLRPKRMIMMNMSGGGYDQDHYQEIPQRQVKDFEFAAQVGGCDSIPGL